jgi:hypothetical protein
MTGFSSRGSNSLLRRALLVTAFAFASHGEMLAQWVTTGGPVGGEVVSLAADSQYVYIGTTQGHVWRRLVSDIVTHVEATTRLTMQTQAVVLTNYPNPCNAYTVFSISLHEASQATILIFDVLGRNVMTVLDQRLEAGSYRFPADLGSLASGLYFYRLRAGEVQEVRKMVILK